MGLIERAVVENLLVHRAGGDEHETTDLGFPRGFNKLQGAEHVLLDEFPNVALRTTESPPRPIESRVDHRIATFHQSVDAVAIAQIALDPLEVRICSNLPGYLRADTNSLGNAPARPDGGRCSDR